MYLPPPAQKAMHVKGLKMIKVFGKGGGEEFTFSIIFIKVQTNYKCFFVQTHNNNSLYYINNQQEISNFNNQKKKNPAENYTLPIMQLKQDMNQAYTQRTERCPTL